MKNFRWILYHIVQTRGRRYCEYCTGLWKKIFQSSSRILYRHRAFNKVDLEFCSVFQEYIRVYRLRDYAQVSYTHLNVLYRHFKQSISYFSKVFVQSSRSLKLKWFDKNKCCAKFLFVFEIYTDQNCTKFAFSCSTKLS